MGQRSATLIRACKKLLTAHERWVQDPNRQNPDDSYWDAVENVLETFKAGDIPADCRELNEFVVRFSREVERHDQNTEVNPDNQYPHDSFWGALGEIRDHITGRIDAPLPPLETIPELRSQGVGDEQIARIYGFFDRHGRLMPWLVKREIDNPDSVLKAEGAIDGRTWIDPRIAERTTSLSIADDDELEKHAAAAEDSKPCPETPAELWEQNVPASQAARMLRKPQAEVEALFAKLTADHEKAKKKESKQPAETAGSAK